VISRTTEKFRALFMLLPEVIKIQAKEAYLREIIFCMLLLLNGIQGMISK
jgi:hypothetical protein